MNRKRVKVLLNGALFAAFFVLFSHCGSAEFKFNQSDSSNPDSSGDDGDPGDEESLPTSVVLSWDPNPVSDRVTGYNIYWGTESGIYTESLDVGNKVTSNAPAPTYPSTYFYVVTAYNGAGLESLPSNEVSVSTLKNRSLAPPDFLESESAFKGARMLFVDPKRLPRSPMQLTKIDEEEVLEDLE